MGSVEAEHSIIEMQAIDSAALRPLAGQVRDLLANVVKELKIRAVLPLIAANLRRLAPRARTSK